MHPIVSVIVPVFNNESGLALCLAGLAEQTYPADRLEVVVVDNGSRVDPAPVVERFSGQRMRLVREARVGSYAARNAGVVASRGDVIAFTDSDCVPDREWLKRGVAHVTSDPRIGLVAGEVEMFVRDPARPSIAELLDVHEYGFAQRKVADRSRYGATANVFTTRAVWDCVGPFDATLKSVGDFAWGRRVAEHGFSITFEREAVVRHPARRTFGEMSKRQIRTAGGMVDFYRRSGRPLFPLLAKHARPPFGGFERIARNESIAGLGRKVACMAMMQSLRLVAFGAIVRVALGADSLRG